MADGRSNNGRWADDDGRRRRGRCLHCRQPGLQIAARGLCWSCYRLRSRRAYQLVLDDRRGWTDREYANAVVMAGQGQTRREIARVLGRSVESVKNKLKRAAWHAAGAANGSTSTPAPSGTTTS